MSKDSTPSVEYVITGRVDRTGGFSVVKVTNGVYEHIETFDLESRGASYDRAAALRDTLKQKQAQPNE